MSYRNSNNSSGGRWNNRGGNRTDYSTNNNRDRRFTLTDDEHRLVNQGRDELFHKEKSFPLITSLKDNSLLLRQNLFISDKWNIDELIKLKERLNDTRNRLNEKDIKVWKQLTFKTNMTGRVVWSLRSQNRIEMCTNAWIKMAEIFSKYENLIPRDLPDKQPFQSLHVCEAPGAFICTTNFYQNKRYGGRDPRSLQRQWKWTGLSLNPYYEGNDQVAMVDDDRFIIETLDKWYFGIDNSGNILSINNIKALWDKVRVDPVSTGVHLVTGDGSVDTSGDPNEQESIVSELHYTEAVCAMGALVKGGSLVLKMFSLLECETVCLLYILALHFKELSIFKPASSRAPNGETYVIGLGFRGIAPEVLSSLLSFVSPQFPPGKALLSLDSIPRSFVDALIKIAEYFTTKQVQAIERNLELEKVWNRNIEQAIFQLNQDVVKEFRQRCSIDYNYQQPLRIVTNVELDGSAKELRNGASVAKGGLQQREGGTLQDRQSRKRDREEFLLGTTTNNDDDDDVNDETEEETANKRRSLGQGKTVALGSNNLVKTTSNDTITTEMEVGSLKNQQQEESIRESPALKMMKKMGHTEGQGLGAHGQGRSKPIEVVMHDTRLGLGHHNQPSVTLSSSSGLPIVFDEPLFSDYDRPISTELPFKSSNNGPVTVASGLRSVLSSLFVKYEDLESLYKKREEYIENQRFNKTKIFISDQLELLNKEEKYRDIHGIYINCRTAFELASLDKIFKLTLITFDNSNPLSFIIDNISLTGFAEYLIWQQQDHVNGTIISDLKNSFSMSSNVFYKSQIDPNPPKVHLFFSDLSILPTNVKINQRYIEQYNKHQMIISCRNALTKLNKGGHFVCKLLDTFTRFTSGLIYLLYHSFKSISILRPFTLDPSSSQRFLVCYELKDPLNISIIQHLNYLLQSNQTNNILEVVSLKSLIEPQFQKYMANTNQRLLRREVQALTKRLWVINQGNNQQINVMIKDEHWKEAHESVTVFRRPRPRVLPVEPDSGIRLPPGWTKGWSKKEERQYYFNTNTGESRWEPPN